jgi:hypothetical protein
MITSFITRDILGWEAPPPRRPIVRLASLVAARAEVYRAMRQAGMSKAEFARRIRLAPEAVDRLFTIHDEIPLHQIWAALATLGERLVVTVETTRSGHSAFCL